MIYRRCVRDTKPTIAVNWSQGPLHLKQGCLQDSHQLSNHLNKWLYGKFQHYITVNSVDKYYSIINSLYSLTGNNVNHSILYFRSHSILTLSQQFIDDSLRIHAAKDGFVECVTSERIIWVFRVFDYYIKTKRTHCASIGWSFFGPLTTPAFAWTCRGSSNCSFRPCLHLKEASIGTTLSRTTGWGSLT